MKRYLIVCAAVALWAWAGQAATTSTIVSVPTSTTSSGPMLGADGCAAVGNITCLDCSRRPTGEYQKIPCCPKNFRSCCAKQRGLISKQDLRPEHSYSLTCNPKATDAGQACSSDAECTYGCELKKALRFCEWRKTNLAGGDQVNKYICPESKPGKCRLRPNDTKLKDKINYYYIDGKYVCEMIRKIN